MMGSAGITNVGPINTPTTGTGAIAGFDPIMRLSKATKKRKKQESAGKQWERRRNDPTYIDGRSKTARNLIKRLAKRKKKMSEETILEAPGSSGGDTTKQAYQFIAQKRKVQKKREREERNKNRKAEITMIARAKATDYQKKAKERQKKLSQSLTTSNSKQQNNSYEFDGLTYLESFLEQIISENTSPVFYFFNDETELEVTREMAEEFLSRFGKLSEENMEKFMEMLPESGDNLITFMQM